jgi:transcriptional regulator with XRE-family HTH domain
MSDMPRIPERQQSDTRCDELKLSHADTDELIACSTDSGVSSYGRRLHVIVHGDERGASADDLRVGDRRYAGEGRGLGGMARFQDPAAHRRHLQRELRRYRSEAGLTQRDVAQELEWSPSKVIRIESGNVAVSTTDLRALLALYKVTDPPTVEELVDNARSSRKASWAEYRDVISQATATYFGYESSASIVRQFEPLFVPGLLQIEEYTRAVLSGSYELSEEEIDRHVEARLARQQLLDRDSPPKMFFILDEAVIHRQVGGPGVMRRQLEYLVEIGRREQVSIQVLPFALGAHTGLRGPFVLLEFEYPSDDLLLYLESRTDTVTRDDPDQIGKHLDMFQDLEKSATRPEELSAVLPGMGEPKAAEGGKRKGGAATA